MKYFIAIAFFATVASALPAIKPHQISAELAEIQEIITAIQSPSTDPATAAALEQMLFDVLGLKPQPISVGPAIVDFPLPDGGAVSEEAVVPAPVVVTPTPAANKPLVQIILNINQAESSPIAVGPVVTPELVEPTPVQVVDVAPSPIQIVEPAPVAPIAVHPIGVAPPQVEPVIIGVPIIPEPAVVLPEELN